MNNSAWHIKIIWVTVFITTGSVTMVTIITVVSL